MSHAKGPPDPNAKDADDSGVESVMCFVCETDLTERGKGDKDKKKKDKGEKDGLKPGLVDISSEGTGFAGGGKNMATRDGVAFQC